MNQVNEKSIRYKLDSKDKPRQWQCWYSTDSTGVWGIFTTDGLVGGNIKDPVFKASKEKNLGKVNYMSCEMQAQVMQAQEVGKKERSGYYTTLEEAENNKIFLPTGCPSGMVWEEYKDKNHIVYPALASGKLDGSKMLSMQREGRTYLSTRSGKEHMNFEHIQESLDKFYEEFPNIVLDGEAYNHEYADRFEDLQSIFRKQKPTAEQKQVSKDIAKFYIYDVVDKDQPNMTADERQDLLRELFDKYLFENEYLVYWPSYWVHSEEEYDVFHEGCMDDGYEGSVLKIADQPYRNNKNKYVMKRKPKFDCEFKILEVIEGEGTASGTAQKMTIDITSPAGMNTNHQALLVGTTQEAGMASGWDHAKLTKMLGEPEEYIGYMGTIEYGGITKHGKLRFPKFKSRRDGMD